MFDIERRQKESFIQCPNHAAILGAHEMIGSIRVHWVGVGQYPVFKTRKENTRICYER
jgi:hypothetical protein